jgi:hypothetical protein
MFLASSDRYEAHLSSVKFEVGFIISFARLCMSNKKWYFSWRMVSTFPKIGVSNSRTILAFSTEKRQGHMAPRVQKAKSK